MTSGLRYALAIVALGTEMVRADVVTSLEGSRLFITGDQTADSIAITPSGGELEVTGFDGTLVDGSSEAVAFSGVRRVTIRLKQGADRVAVSWVTLPGGLDIGMGKGDDTVELDAVAGGPVEVATSQGHDLVNVFGPSGIDSLSIGTGSGNDRIVVDGVSVWGDLDVVAGRDEDDASITWVDVYDDVDVHMSDGDDVLWFGEAFVDGEVHLDGGGGDNWLALFGYLAFWGDVDIDDFGDDFDWWW